MANGHKNHNFIPRLLINNDTLKEPKDISKIFMEKFKHLFGHKRDFHFKIDFLKLLEKKVPIDLTSLDRHFTLEEIKRVVFDLGGDKALGPDCFLCNFSKFPVKRLREIF